MYVIYADILFFINLIMDMIIFFIASMLLNKCIKFKRIVFGSMLAALIFCLILYIPFIRGIPYMLYALFIPVLPILYIFRPLFLKEFIKNYLVCTGTSCLLGGSVFSLWYVFGYYSGVESMSLIWLVAIGLGIGLMIYFSFFEIRKRFISPFFEYDISIIHAGKEIGLKSLMDTGNCLYTPFGHKPVIIVQYDALKALFTNEQIAFLEKNKNNLLELARLDSFKPSCIIPFNSVGCKLGMLLGIEVDTVNIHKNCFKKSINKCIVGVAFDHLFYDKSYCALLHPDFILN